MTEANFKAWSKERKAKKTRFVECDEVRRARVQGGEAAVLRVRAAHEKKRLERERKHVVSDVQF